MTMVTLFLSMPGTMQQQVDGFDWTPHSKRICPPRSYFGLIRAKRFAQQSKEIQS